MAPGDGEEGEARGRRADEPQEQTLRSERLPPGRAELAERSGTAEQPARVAEQNQVSLLRQGESIDFPWLRAMLREDKNHDQFLCFVSQRKLRFHS